MSLRILGCSPVHSLCWLICLQSIALPILHFYPHCCFNVFSCLLRTTCKAGYHVPMSSIEAHIMVAFKSDRELYVRTARYARHLALLLKLASAAVLRNDVTQQKDLQ